MLTLKNSTMPTEPPVLSDTVARDAAEKAQKRWQLEHGRTRARVDALTADLSTARAHEDQLKQRAGECLVDERDATAIMEEVRQASHRVQALDLALASARQKNDAAQRALTDAERQVAIELDDQALTVFKSRTRELEGLMFGEMQRLVDQVSAAHQAVKDRGAHDTGVMHQLGKFIGVYPTYLLRANSALISEGRRYIPDIDKEMKPLSAWVDDVKHALAYCRRQDDKPTDVRR